jgi:hypothetical protein
MNKLKQVLSAGKAIIDEQEYEVANTAQQLNNALNDSTINSASYDKSLTEEVAKLRKNIAERSVRNVKLAA